MQLSVLHWNLQLDNQLPSQPERQERLLKELERLLTTYQPDCLSLNEVVQPLQGPTPVVLDYLGDRGYPHIQYAADYQLTSKLIMGTALCTRVKPMSVETVEIGYNSAAERRGFGGMHKTAVMVSLPVGKRAHVKLISTHLLLLRSYTIKDHYAGADKLEKLIRERFAGQAIVLMGDFNQPGWMPRSFKQRTADFLQYRSGRAGWPTWRNHANPYTLARANLDYIYWTKRSELQLQSFEVVDSNISDHRPLVATFTLQK